MQCAKPILLLIGIILLSVLLGSGRPAPALAQDDEPADAVDVTTICDTGQDFADCDGPTSVVGQASSGNFAFMPALFPNPSVLLFDMTNILAGQPEVFVPESGQILGIFTDPLFPQPGEFRINLPIEPTGAFLDVDNDGEEEAGVQIYALTVGSNLFGSSHLQQLEQATGLESYIMNIVTGQITEGTFLVYAPDDAQDFPAAPGADGIWFTEDDPTVTLPAGYTMVTLPKEGGSTLDRSAQVAMNTIERAEQTSPDFSDQGILESYNSLIDTLIDRYAYTELRGLDWESIRAEYLPQVEQADAAEDYGTYYNVLKAIAASLNDTHVSASSKDVSVIEAAAASADAPTTATVGATAFAAWDETTEKLGDRILVLTVGENSPAADAGWVPGTEIIAIDGEPVADRVAAVTLPSGIGTEEVRLARQASELLYFADGQSVTFEYRLPDTTETMTATMVAGDYELGIQGVPAVTGSTPVVYREIDDYAVVRWSDFVEYVLPKLAVLEEALAREQSRASGGVILDLRGNGGGWVTLYETMASYFFIGDDPMPVHLFDSYFFDSAAGKHVQVFPVDYMISAPNPDFAYTGPVVVLVDQGCASACEYFSQHLQLLERATVIGQYPTSGAGGTIERVTMPKGITFQFTQGGTYFAGTDEPNLEAKGVVPDVRVPITVETEQAKLRGEDPVMDAAVAFLDQKADRLVDNTWRWAAALDPALNPTPVEGDADYLITFNADGTLSITADCNQVNGAYERSDGDTVSITLGTSTLAQCPEGSLSDDFLAYLSAASAIAFENQNLALVLSPPVGDAFALLFGPVEMEAPADDTAVDTEAAGTSALSQEALRNATYSGIYDEPVTLTDGLYEDGPLTVQYLDGSEMVTDLDGDGVEDAVAFLLERGGGTANILYMAAQLNQEGQPVDAGAVRLDEVRIKSAAVLDGQIQLEIITMGPGDGDCCPSHKAIKAFAYQDGQLVEVPGEEQELVQVSADDLNGTSWTLIEINHDTPALPDTEISVSFADGKITGFGGCNDYHSRFILGKDNPFVMTTSPVVSTQRACPEPILDQETAFFSALDDVAQWGYEFGRLALYYLDEGSGEYGRLLFAPRPASAELMADDGEDALAGVLWANPWRWVSFTNPVDQFDVEVPESYLLAFDEDGTVNIVADCNNAGGTYSDEDGALTIELGPMTMAACPPESRSDQFVQYLGFAARYFFQDGGLYIDLFADGGTMAFAPAEAEAMADDSSTGSVQRDEGAMVGSLTANDWQWVSFTSPVEQFDVEMPENYQLRFLDDGTISVTADCNSAFLPYTDEEGSLTVEAGAMTLALCPGESRSDQFVALLGGAARYFFADGNLFIDLLADGGTLEFAPIAPLTLTSNPWQWLRFTGNSGVYDIEMPESYLLTFKDDGTVNIVADCNNALGDYTDENGDLTISVGPATLALCPEDSRSEEFVQLLGGAQRYFIEGENLFIVVEEDGGTLSFGAADPEIMADDTSTGSVQRGEGAMAGAPLPPAEIANDEGGVEVVTGEFSYTSYTVQSRLRDNVIGLLNSRTIIERDNTTFIGTEDQVLGRATGPISPSPITYEIMLPINPPGPSIDVDNDGEEDAGVRIYHVAIGPDFYGSNYMDAIEQDYFKSWLRDQATGAITAANLLIFAPDDTQGFPADAGDDGFYFTEDDTVVGLPAGYTVAMLGDDGVVTFDRSRQASVDVLESASASSPDFSDQGIQESYNSLIDMLTNRYAYTELRGLDWEVIRETYLPQVEAADETQDYAGYYIALRQMAESIGDAHVQVIGQEYSGAYLALADELLGANLGAQLVELDDGRFIITYINPDGPAAAEGWQFGTEIISVDGVPIEEHVESQPYFQSLGTPENVRLARVANALRFPEGSTTTIEYILPGENELQSATLAPVFGINDVLPEETPPEFEWRRLEGGAGYISWKDFTNLAYENASLVNALNILGTGVPGIILDLRGNGGGNVGLLYALSSYFFTPDDPGSIGWIDEYFYDPTVGEQVKTFEAAFSIYSPRPDITYAGPLVVLVDNRSASAGEYMPQFLQTEGRAIVVGEHSTEGAGGTVQRASLPGGLGLQFTQGRTTFAGTDELNLEAKGVTLDVEVPITEENERAKLDGVDVVLNAGLEALADVGAQLAGEILPGTTWQLIQQSGLVAPAGEVENPGAYTLTFGEAGEQTVTIQADCNTVNAEYTLGAGTITITLGPSTLAECPAGSLSEPFLEALSEASGIQIDPQGSALVITSGELSLQAMLFAPADGDVED